MVNNTNDAPLISIVTPSFNQGEFIGEAIESVLAQNFTDFEYLIVDGGSTDESCRIIESYADRLAYWVSEADDGQSHAINKGFRRARGQIVAWLNADDLYMPGAFAAMADAFRSNPEAPFYYGNGYRGNLAGKPIASFYERGTVEFNRKGLAFGLNYILQPCTFINHQVLRSIGYVDESLHYGMDSDLWLRLSSVTDPAAIVDHIALSREYENTKTSTGSFGRVEELRQISQAHTNEEITPGVVLYYLDCLNSAIIQSQKSGSEVFTTKFQQELLKFWQQTGNLLHQFDVGNDGIPKKVIADG